MTVPGFPGRPFTVVYDGRCRVCKRMARLLKRWDHERQLEILPSQSVGLRSRFPWIPPAAYAESIQLIDARSGQTWQGAAAIELLLDTMPRGALITWGFSIPFARPVAEKFYRWFARNRYRLGCGEHCQVTERPLDYDEGE